MQPVVIELAGPPEAKGRARSALIRRRDGGSFISNYTPANTRKYESHLRLAAQQAMGDRPLIDGPVWLRVDAAMTIPTSWSDKKRKAAAAGLILPTKKPDWDNYAKICDSLNGVVFNDDVQVCAGMVFKFYSERPRLRIEVREIELHTWPVLVQSPPETLPLFARGAV